MMKFSIYIAIVIVLTACTSSKDIQSAIANFTATPSPSASPSPTASPSATPSATPSPSVTVTATPIPTVVPVVLNQLLPVDGDASTVSLTGTRILTARALSGTTGLPVAGVTVNFSIMPVGSATLSRASAVTDANGNAQTTLTAGSTPSSVTVLAASGSGSCIFNVTLGSTNSNATVVKTHGDLTSITTAGTEALQVLTLDGSNNPIPNASVTFTLVSGGSGTVTGGGTAYSTLTDGSGYASTLFTPTSTTGTMVILASVGSYGTTTFTVSVMPVGTPSQLVLATAGPTLAAAGACSALSVTGTDLGGNPMIFSNSTAKTVNLSESGSGTFYSDGSCTSGNEVTTRSIVANQSSTTVYFKSTLAQTENLYATATGVNSASLGFTIQAGAFSTIALNGPSAVGNAVCSPAFGIVLQDSNGNNAVAGTTLQIDLTGSNHGIFYSDSACAAAVTSVSIPSDTSSGVFYYKNTHAAGESASLVGTQHGTALASSALPVTVLAAGAPTKLALSTLSPFASAGVCSSAMSVTSTDSIGNPVVVGSTTQINLSASGAGSFYSDNTCTNPNLITHLNISSGTSSSVFYFKSNLAQSANVFAADNTLSMSSATLAFLIEAGAQNQLTLSGPEALQNSVCSSAYTVSILDALNNPSLTASSTTVTLAGGGSGTFYSDSGCGHSIASISVPAYQTSVPFYFKDSTGETLTLAASNGSLSAGSLGLTVSSGGAASKLVMNSIGAVFGAGVCSSAISITSTDYSGNPLSVSGAKTVNLSASGTGTFYLDGSCTTGNEITTVSIADGTSANNVYFKASAAQGENLYAGASGFVLGTFGVTIQAGVPSTINVSGPANLGNSTCSSAYAVTLKDARGNLATTGSSTVIGFAGSLGAATLYGDSACAGALAGSNVTIPGNVSSALFYLKDATGETFTLGGSNGGLAQGATVGVTVGAAGLPSKLALSTVVAPLVSVGACTAITVGGTDNFGNPLAFSASVPKTINLTKSGLGTFYSDSSCTSGNEITSVAIAAYATVATAYFKTTVAQTENLFASASGVSSASDALTIQAGSFTAIALNGPTAVGNNVCSPAFGIALQDSNGNNATSGSSTQVDLTGASHGAFYSDSGCAASITSITIPANTSSGVFYFKDNYSAGESLSFIGTKHGTGTASSALSVNLIAAGAPTMLKLSALSPFSNAGVCSSAMSVSTTDDLGNPLTVIGSTQINLIASGPGTFYSDSACANPNLITHVTLASGTSSGTFYFKSSAAQTLNVYAVDNTQVLNSGTLAYAVQSGAQNQITLAGPLALANGACSSGYTVSILDSLGNPATASTSTAVSLSGGGAGTFYSDSGCGQSTASLSIPAYSSGGTFYLKDSTAQTLTLAASNGGLSTGNLSVTIAGAGLPTKLMMNSITPVLTAGACSSAITITSTDYAGNPLNVSGSKSVTLSQSGTGTFYSDLVCTSGNEITTISIGNATSSNTVYFKAASAQVENLYASTTGFILGSFGLTIEAGAPATINVTGPANIGNNTCSTAYTATLKDAQGNAATSSGATVIGFTGSLGSSVIYADQSCLTALSGSNLSIPGNSSSASFYLKDVTGETFTVGGSNGGLTQGTTVAVTVGAVGLPSKLVLSTQVAPLVAAGACTPVTVTGTDNQGNPLAFSASVAKTITLGQSGVGTYYSDSSCTPGNEITNTTIAANATAATVYFKTTTAQTQSLTASGTGVSSASYALTVQAGSFSAIALTGVTAVGNNVCSPAFGITLQDANGNSAVSASSTQIDLTGNTHGNFYSDSGCAAQVSSITLPANSSTSTFYFKDNYSAGEALSFIGTKHGTVTASQALAVSISASSAPSQLVMNTITPYETAGTCSAPLVISSTDVLGNPLNVASNSSITLSTNGSGSFYTASDCGSGLIAAPVILSSGTSSLTVYFKASTAQNLTLRATASALNAASLNFAIQADVPAAIVLAGAGAITNGVCSSAFSVRLNDTLGNPAIYTTSKTIALSGKGSGNFYSDSGCATAIAGGNLTLPSYTASGVFYFKDSTAESLTLATNYGSLTPGSLSVTVPTSTIITPTQLTLTSVSPYTTVGVCSSALVITATDNYGNAGNVTGDKSVTLSSSLIGGAFYTGSGCTIGTIISAPITIASGTSSATVYYKNSVAGNTVLSATAVASGLSAGTYNFALQAAVASGLTISGTSNITNAMCTPYVVSLVDSSGNVASASSATTATLSGKGSGAFYSDSVCSSSTSSVSMAQYQSSATFYFKDSVNENLTFTAANGSIPLTSGTLAATVAYISSLTTPNQLLATQGNNTSVATSGTKTLKAMAVNGVTGAAVAGVVVNFQVVPSANGTLTSGSTTATSVNATTDSNGYATVTFNAGTNLGPVVIIATSSSGNATFSITVGPTGLGYQILKTQGDSATIQTSGGSPSTQVLQVLVLDSNNTPVTDGTAVNFAISSGQSGSLTGGFSTASTTTTSGYASTTYSSGSITGTVSVVATASAIGSVSFTLNVGTSGGGGSSVAFNPTALTTSTNSSAWNHVAVGASVTQSVTLTNSSGANIYVNAITATPSVFTIASDNCGRAPTALASTATCTITFSYAPTDTTTSNGFGYLNWSSSSNGASAQVSAIPLTGVGPAPLTFAGIASVDTISYLSMVLHWSAASGGTVSGYHIYQNGVYLDTAASGATSYSVSGLASGTSYSFKVEAFNTAGVEDGNSVSISKTTLATSVLLTTISGKTLDQSSFANKDWLAGTNYYFDVNNTAGGTPGNDNLMAYTCTVGRTINGTSTGKSACSSSTLPGIYCANSGCTSYSSTPFNTSTGFFSWTPSYGAEGTYEFSIAGTYNSSSTGTEYFTINVVNPTKGIDGTAGTNLLADWRGAFSNTTYACTNSTCSSGTTWADIFSTFTGTISTAGYTGANSNAVSSPLALNFPSAGTTSLTYNTNLLNGNSYNQYWIDLVVNNDDTNFSSSSSTHGRVIASKSSDTPTASGNGNGFSITQYLTPDTIVSQTKQIKFSHDISYYQTIINDAPVVYYRADDAAGATATITDYGTYNGVTGGNPGTLGGTNGADFTSAAGALNHEGTNKALKAVNANAQGSMFPNSNAFKPSGGWSYEAWFSIPTGTSSGYPFGYASTVSDGTELSISSSALGVPTGGDGCAAFTFPANQYIDGTFHHWVITHAGSAPATKNIYVDGIWVASITSGCTLATTWAATPTYRGVNFSSATNGLIWDEFAVYNYALTQTQVQNHFSAATRTVVGQSAFPANPTLQLGPVGYWRLGETGTNTIAADSSGYNNNGKYAGTYYHSSSSSSSRGGTNATSTLSATYSGSGYDSSDGSYYNGTNDATDYVSVPASPSLTFSSTFSVSAWYYAVNPSASSTTYDLFGEPSVFELLHAASTGHGQLTLSFAGSNTISATTTATGILPAASGVNPATGWMHIAAVYNGSGTANNDKVKLYVNGRAYPVNVVGTLPSSLTSYYTGGTVGEFRIGAGMGLGMSALGNQAGALLDEVALYNRALSPGEIQAIFTDSTLRYCVAPATTTTFANATPYDYLSVLFNGTWSYLFRNGKQECAMHLNGYNGQGTTMNISNDTNNFTVGASSNGLVGNVSAARVYAKSSGTVATTADPVSNFNLSSDQFRPQQVGLLQKTSNLALHFTAGTARDGVRPWDYAMAGNANGCQTGQNTWRDLSPNNQLQGSQIQGTLFNFSSCGVGSNGWQQDGTPSSYPELSGNPFYLGFLGSSNMYVDAGPFNNLAGTNTMSVCTWIKNSSNATLNPVDTAIVAKGTAASNAFFLGFDHTTVNKLAFNIAGTGNAVTSTGTYNDAAWHYVCGTYDGGANGTAIRLYIDGNYQNKATYTTNIASTTDELAIGASVTQLRAAVTKTYTGGVSAVQIYNTALSATDIYLNCLAQAPGYTSTASTTFCTHYGSDYP